MLAMKADIVFVVDESTSGTQASFQEWLRQVVTGDLDQNATNELPSLADQLSASSITDVRYGLVGFGQIDEFDNDRFSHSQFFPAPSAHSLLGDPAQLTTAQLNAAFGGLEEDGDREDGWDALEHAIAEYDFRPGAVPVFVLVQNEEGRVPLNDTLTRNGVFAALRSKNAILNVMVVGDNVIFPNGTAAFDLKVLLVSPSRALAA